MIAVDALKELNPERLELVTANARCHERAIKVPLEKRVGKIAHCKIRSIEAREPFAAIAHNRNGRMKCMGFASKAGELFTRLRSVLGFCEALALQGQGLVGADNEPP